VNRAMLCVCDREMMRLAMSRGAAECPSHGEREVLASRLIRAYGSTMHLDKKRLDKSRGREMATERLTMLG
jgi:hypothetical protein